MPMKKTIAVIVSLDTKEAEAAFIRERIADLGCDTFLIDVGARGCKSLVPDIGPCEVVLAGNREWQDLYQIPKHEMIQGLTEGISLLMPKLHEQGKFDAVLSIGGLQNTTIGVGAMKSLPVGVPKLMVSTVVSGQRTLEALVGTKDILLMPSIADLSGINLLTTTILGNAVAAICGMAMNAGQTLPSTDRIVIGATMMGVTNDGVVRAVRHLEEAGCEVLSFHSTGVGGRAMEEFISQGIVKAVMDLSLHEITAEMFGGGYSFGANNRLCAAGGAGIPMVVAPGAIDFIDYSIQSVPDFIGRRKSILHNAGLIHLKLTRDEMAKVGGILAERLNAGKGPVTVLLPLRGFRQCAGPGEVLCDPEADNALIETMHAKLRADIRIVEIDANINDEVFSRIAADEMLKMIGKR